MYADDRAAVRFGDHRVGSLQQDRRPAPRRRSPHPVQLAGTAAEVRKQPAELPFMRGEQCRTANAPKEKIRFRRERGNGVGVENEAASCIEGRED